MVTRRSSQDDAAGDPTVYIAASVHVEIYTDEHTAALGGRPFVTLHLSADHVTLTRTFLFIRCPGVPASTYPLDSVRSFQVDIRPRPADYDELRQQYPNAYEPWDAGGVAGLRHQRTRNEIEQIAIRTGRPPEHVREKLAAPEAPAVVDGPVRRGEPAPLHRMSPEDRIEGAYIVVIQRGTDPLEVAARHGVDPTSVYRGVLTGFAAVMTDSQVGALRDDIDVDYLSEDARVTLD